MKIGQYSNAKRYYQKAETLVTLIPDDLEQAEINYQFALFSCYLFQPLNTMIYATKAKEIYSKEVGYSRFWCKESKIFENGFSKLAILVLILKKRCVISMEKIYSNGNIISQTLFC
ncbi:hypothetical protein WAG19_29365 [Bacillus cereus]|uniref:hypothetical protein n=1 Tax=Bacillus cereus TaxID=1396 RepID=UPI0030129E00